MIVELVLPVRPLREIVDALARGHARLERLLPLGGRPSRRDGSRDRDGHRVEAPTECSTSAL